ncbi:MAG: hypothetical protein AABW59_03780 [archaeon]
MRAKAILILTPLVFLLLTLGCVCPPSFWQGPLPPGCSAQEITPPIPGFDSNKTNYVPSADETPKSVQKKVELIDVSVEVITPRSDKNVSVDINGQIYNMQRINEIYSKFKLSDVEKGGEYVLSFDGKTRSGTLKEYTFDYFPEPGTGREFFKGYYVAACHYCGVSYTRGNFLEPARTAYAEMKKNGATWVNLIPVWFFDDIYSSTVRPIYREEYGLEGKSGWQHATITDTELKTLINDAHAAGLKVYLSPHVASINWGPDVKGKNDWAPKDINTWVESFGEFTKHYSSIAEETGVEIYSIGNELGTIIDPNHENNPGVKKEHWYEIIDIARDNYSGPLTFSETCTSTDYCVPEHIEVWDKLDYIGYEWYVPINVDNNATLEEITAGAEKIFDESIEPLSKKFNKPIIFTEIGFEAKPHVWNRSYEGGGEGNFDKLAAAMAYDAILEAAKDENYVKGMMVWTWTLGEDKHFDNWVYEYNGNEVTRSLTWANLGKWFSYYK